MRKTFVYCPRCHKKLGEEHTDYKCIKLPKGDLDVHGIWCGDIGKHIWFDGEEFCSWRCFKDWLGAKYRKLKESGGSK